MFDAIKVKEDKLDLVIQHDVSLIENAESIKAEVEKATRMVVSSDEWRAEMDSVISKVEEFDKLIDERSNIFRGLQT
jgi:hypothetical protein